MKLKYNESLPKYMLNVYNINCINSLQRSWLHEHGCTHRHSYLRHFNCFLNEWDMHEDIAFLDIETSNLKANFGIVLCWCILDDKGNLYEDRLTKKDIMSGQEDKRCVQSCINTLSYFDRVVTHYGTYFDIPFLRTRSLIHKLDFFPHGYLYHTDTWKMAKRSLCLHSNRQDVIAESLYGKTVKTRISHPDWRKAMLGDVKAMDEVVDHCEKDVIDLKKNYYTLLPYCKIIRSSV